MCAAMQWDDPRPGRSASDLDDLDADAQELDLDDLDEYGEEAESIVLTESELDLVMDQLTYLALLYQDNGDRHQKHTAEHMFDVLGRINAQR